MKTLIDYRLRFRSLRKKLGWSQQKTADYLGVHITSLQRWEADPKKDTSASACPKMAVLALEAAIKSLSPP